MNKKSRNGNTPLFIACQHDNPIAVDMFLRYPDAIKQQQVWSGYKNPFHVACRHNGNISILRLIKKQDKILIHSVDADGRTPLFFTQPKLLQFLKRECKVDFNVKDKNGQTAFHYNCAILNCELSYQLLTQFTRDEGVLYSIDYKVKTEFDGNALDSYGNNPLFSIIKSLFDGGIDETDN